MVVAKVLLVLKKWGWVNILERWYKLDIQWQAFVDKNIGKEKIIIASLKKKNCHFFTKFKRIFQDNILISQSIQKAVIF